MPFVSFLHYTVKKYNKSSLVKSKGLMERADIVSIHKKENSCQILFAGIHTKPFMLTGLIITFTFTAFTVVQKFTKIHNSNSASY